VPPKSLVPPRSLVLPRRHRIAHRRLLGLPGLLPLHQTYLHRLQVPPSLVSRRRRRTGRPQLQASLPLVWLHRPRTVRPQLQASLPLVWLHRPRTVRRQLQASLPLVCRPRKAHPLQASLLPNEQCRLISRGSHISVVDSVEWRVVG